MIEHIFKHFYLGAARHGDNTGLGLTIASRAVTTHQGRTRAENHSDSGLCVIIELPYDQKSP